MNKNKCIPCTTGISISIIYLLTHGGEAVEEADRVDNELVEKSHDSSLLNGRNLVRTQGV